MQLPLPEAYALRMQAQLKEDYPAYIAALKQPPVRGLRVHTGKVSVEEFLRLTPWALKPLEHAQGAFLLEQEAPHIGMHPLHRAGLFYMQEPTAMRPAALLLEHLRKSTGIHPDTCLLDLCAAPGGKAGQLLDGLNHQGILLANEVEGGRAAVLRGNLERLGARNALISSMRPEALCERLPGYFDAVLVDAPCSGEGMFRKNPQAVLDWSPAHVRACAARQTHILSCAAATLRPGGLLVYATCTFSTEENEDVIRSFIMEAPAFKLINEERLYPHTSPGEGQYVALLRKEGEGLPIREKAALPPLPKEAAAAWTAFVQDCFVEAPPGVPMLLTDGRLLLLPEHTPANSTALRLLCAGVHAGEYRNGRFIPAHGLCMAYPACAFQRSINAAPDELALYFEGNVFRRNIMDGYVVVCANGYPVGWGKAVQGVIKNHLPKGLRGPVIKK